MTKEQYQRACEINERLQQLKQVKEAIHGTATHRLMYVYNRNINRDDYTPCANYIMHYISNLLDTHDKMIRAEIENEIASLEQEIEAL